MILSKEQLVRDSKTLKREISNLRNPIGIATAKHDGIVNFDEYLTASPRILWVLKEPNAENSTESYDISGALYDFARRRRIKTDWGNTYNLVAKVSFGILHGKSWGEVGGLGAPRPEVVQSFDKIGIVNVSKFPVGSTTDMKKLRVAYDTQGGILGRQIKAFKPQVIICGKTIDFVDWAIGLTDYQLNTDKGFRAFSKAEQLVIAADHPGVRSSHQKYYDSVMDIYNAWRQ